MAVLCLDSHPL